MNKIFTIACLVLILTLSVLELSAQRYDRFVSAKASAAWSEAPTWSATLNNGPSATVIPTSTTVVAPTSPSTVPVTVVRIQAGHQIRVTGRIEFTVPIILEIYGTLEIYKTSNGISELVLAAGSIIKIAPGGDILASSATGADNANFLTIGGQKINGSQINGLVSPNELTEENIRDGGTGMLPLPVELLYFQAGSKEGGVLVEWASAKEWDFSHYTLERSTDGRSFVPVHVIYVDGESTTKKTYNYLDKQANYGVNYYRLKATDIDFTEEYKGMAVAYFGVKGDLKIYPNPASKESITVSNPGAVAGTWMSITNISGKEVLRVQVTASEQQITTHSLPQGMYILKVWNDFEVKQSKFVVK